MAQQKIVDYQLLAAAGAAMVKPVTTRTETGWTKFIEETSEFLVYQTEKTDDFIAAMPEVDMSKVDDKMTEKTSAFISEKRDIIVDASETLAWTFNKKSDKYKEAILKYNNATQAIVNYNANLDIALAHRQGGVAIDGEYTFNTDEFSQINTKMLVNGDAFDQWEILDNGDIKWNNYAHDPTAENPQESILLKNYKLPLAKDMSMQAMYVERISLLLDSKTAGLPKDFDVKQSGLFSQLATEIENASPEAIKDMMMGGKSFKHGINWLEGFLTGEVYDETNKTLMNQGDGTLENFDHTDQNFGLGYVKGTLAYDDAVLALKTGKLSEEILKEFQDYITNSIEREFKSYYPGPKTIQGNNNTTPQMTKDFKSEMKTINRGEVLYVTKPVKINAKGDSFVGGFVQVAADGSCTVNGVEIFKEIDVLSAVGGEQSSKTSGTWIKWYTDSVGNTFLIDEFAATSTSMKSQIAGGLTGNAYGVTLFNKWKNYK